MPHAYDLARDFRRGNTKAGRMLLRLCGRASLYPFLRDAFEDALRTRIEREAPRRLIGMHGILALHGVGVVSLEDAVLLLSPLLRDVSSALRSAASDALAAIDPLGQAARVHGDAVAALRSGALADDPGHATAALLSTQDETRILELADIAIAQLIDGTRDQRLRAIPAVFALAAARDGRALRAYRTLFADGDPVIRRAAVDHLDPMRLDEGEEILLRALDEPHAGLFSAVVAKLGAMRSAKLKGTLAELLAKSTTPDRRKLLRAAIGACRRPTR
jgi:hypothetical protein